MRSMSSSDLSDPTVEENAVFIVKPSVRPRGSDYRGDGFTWADTALVTATGARRMGKRPAALLSVG